MTIVQARPWRLCRLGLAQTPPAARRPGSSRAIVKRTLAAMFNV